VPDCSLGYHNDSITGACVADGGGAITVITNPNNQFDYVGQKHNSGCDYVLALNPNSSNTVLHDTKLYLKSQSYDTVDFNNWYNYAVANDYYALPDTFYTNHPDSLYNKLYNAGLIDITTKNYLTSLNQIVDNVVGNNDPNNSIYSTAASQIISVETSIKADIRLSSNEKRALLSMASVYRYSGEYWGNYILNEGDGSEVLHPNFLGIHIHWKGFWKADAEGALSGGIVAIFTGGVIGNIIGGGLAGSIVHLIFNT
jgi:hypothetical protein